jgi:prepilin-type N-terminal cleavage/methylation domain-containing protein
LPRRLRKSYAFSLIEVLLALAVFSVGVLGLLGIFPIVSEINRGSAMMNQALALAQSKMDELFHAGSYISTQYMSDNPSELGSGYRRWWGEGEPGGNANMQQINVQCVWLEEGRVKSVILTSIIAP